MRIGRWPVALFTRTRVRFPPPPPSTKGANRHRRGIGERSPYTKGQRQRGPAGRIGWRRLGRRGNRTPHLTTPGTPNTNRMTLHRAAMAGAFTQALEFHMKRMTAVLALLFAFTGAAVAQDALRLDESWTISANPYASTTGTNRFNSGIRVARVTSTVDVYVTTGVSATVTTSSTGTLLPAYQTEYFLVDRSDGIAVLSVSATGTVSVTEMTK